MYIININTLFPLRNPMPEKQLLTYFPLVWFSGLTFYLNYIILWIKFTPVEGNTDSKMVRYTHNIGITKPLAPPNTSTTIPFEKDGKPAYKWDGWPDGFFEHDFTLESPWRRQLQQSPSTLGHQDTWPSWGIWSEATPDTQAKEDQGLMKVSRRTR